MDSAAFPPLFVFSVLTHFGVHDEIVDHKGCNMDLMGENLKPRRSYFCQDVFVLAKIAGFAGIDPAHGVHRNTQGVIVRQSGDGRAEEKTLRPQYSTDWLCAEVRP